MTYTASDLKAELEKELACGSGGSRIAQIAFRIYTEHGLDLEPSLDSKLLQLIVMDQGPEFEMTEEELWRFVRDLGAGQTGKNNKTHS